MSKQIVFSLAAASFLIAGMPSAVLAGEPSQPLSRLRSEDSEAVSGDAAAAHPGRISGDIPTTEVNRTDENVPEGLPAEHKVKKSDFERHNATIIVEMEDPEEDLKNDGEDKTARQRENDDDEEELSAIIIFFPIEKDGEEGGNHDADDKDNDNDEFYTQAAEADSNDDGRKKPTPPPPPASSSSPSSSLDKENEPNHNNTDVDPNKDKNVGGDDYRGFLERIGDKITGAANSVKDAFVDGVHSVHDAFAGKEPNPDKKVGDGEKEHHSVEDVNDVAQHD